MKLNVVMLNTFRTHVAMKYEGQHIPYLRRVVQIELTPEQISSLTRNNVGVDCGVEAFEEIGDVWLEG